VTFAEHELWSVGAVTSDLLGFDVGRSDHLAPFRGFVGDELGELGGRHGHWNPTQIRKPSHHGGSSEDGNARLVELVDDLGRCVFGRAQADPSACFIARHEFGHGRDVR